MVDSEEGKKFMVEIQLGRKYKLEQRKLQPQPRRGPEGALAADLSLILSPTHHPQHHYSIKRPYRMEHTVILYVHNMPLCVENYSPGQLGRYTKYSMEQCGASLVERQVL